MSEKDFAIHVAKDRAAILKEELVKAMARVEALSANMLRLTGERDTAVKRAEAAEAIVARLPKTADGVPVIPVIDEVFHPDWCDSTCSGMDVIYFGENHHEEYESLNKSEPPEDLFWVGFGDYSEPEVGWYDAIMKPISECYSTREAAQSAAKGKPE